MARAKKFGAFSGVFTPSILTILGVIMYLRLPWIVGQAGLWATIGIILVAHIISFSTSLSVASIATDKRVGTGGSYYMISRSLGLPIGGTLGLALFVGLSFSISLYLIGFAEVFLKFTGFEATLNNIRIAGALALVALTILTFISTSLAIKSQYIILTALVLSLISVFMGSHEFDPDRPLIAPIEGALPWIALFAIFFPAVTGFEAGVSMSGDLKDPRKNIPFGTVAAVLVGLIVYLGLAFFLSYTVERDLLANDPNVLFQISWIPQLVVMGILFATFSSALGSILGAPRILQATAIDRITPSLLGKGFGVSNEPRNALIFTFVIALSGILIGELNMIARIVTIFFIITYGFLNITYAVESWAGTDFRPTFKIPAVISIIGALACIIVMIQLDVIAMIGASLVLVGIFLFLKRRELTLQTGDTWTSVWASMVKTGLGKLTVANQKPRNWRPNVILFSGGVKQRPYLIEMGKALVGKLGIFTNFELVESKDEKNLFSKNQQIIAEEALDRTGVFTRRHVSRDIYEGIESISKIYGFSGFEPNTILMGWPKNTRNPETFARLAKTFKKLDYNQIYLNYNKEAGFGRMKQIDIWWSGKGRNLSLALALMRFITSADEWRHAQIRILVINQKSNLTDRYYELIGQLLDNQRINAEVKVINNSVEQLPASEIMRSESMNTDLTLLEIGEKDEDFFNHINELVANLKTTMIIRASSGFDELAVVTKETDDQLTVPEEVETPVFKILDKLKLAPREIIANEVFNISKNLEQITGKYYQEGFDKALTEMLTFQDELKSIVVKTTDQLGNASRLANPDDQKTEFLRILNDFSFRAQKSLRGFKDNALVSQKDSLHNNTIRYFEELDNYLREMPAHIRIRYNWKEFRLLKADSFITGLFKIWKLLKARITGQPAVYKIKVERAARYFLFHKRLNTQKDIFHQFALHTFEYIVEIRKILSDLYELIEKGRSESSDKERFKNIIQMERDRFNAVIVLQEERSANFIHSMGNILEKNLLEDLQSFNNLLERPGSNFMSKPFPRAYKNDAEMLDYVSSFPETWHTNINLLINKIYLDFYLNSLKNRIEAKINKYNFDFQTTLKTSLLQPLQDLKKQLEKFVQSGNTYKKPQPEKFRNIDIDEHYHDLYNEITGLFAELPGVMSIAGEDLSKKLEESDFSETDEIIVSVRKTVEFSIASEFIDFVKKQGLEASASLAKSVSGIKDIIRLINFNFFVESDEDPQSVSDKKKLAEDFLRKIEQQEIAIKGIFSGYRESFNKGLKNAFAPLSASIIAKTSGSIEKKFKASKTRQAWGKYSEWLKMISGSAQQQLVNLIYSKSESILWMGRMEKPVLQTGLSNEDVYTFLEKYSPSEQILNQLPFYYSKLFSGQSGIGDDFWVGMEEEMSKASSAIRRFKNGQPGCLIITGERNSGKTGLSKYIARKFFQPAQIHNIRAPRECSADWQLFEQTMLKTMSSYHREIGTALGELQQPTAFIINDLELWWERKSNGTVVVEKLMELIRANHKKVLFIVNLNIHSLKLLNQLTGLQSGALGHVVCSGFDARELQELIMLRHKAGGLSFTLNKKHESELGAWEFASLFNRYFDISQGSPGVTISLWLASIEKVSGKTIYIHKPAAPDLSFLDKISREHIFYLVQFVYHLRLSVNKLQEILQNDRDIVESRIMNLWQSGILVEKFPGIFSINPALHQPLVWKMKELKLI
jgi:amino acid transporter